MQKSAIILCLIFFGLSFNGIGQSKSELLRKAKLFIAHKKEKDAIPVLEKLHEMDEGNGNIAYMLGMCYVLEKKKVSQAIKLLSFASEHYAADYSPTSLAERNVSEYVYYYLIIAHSLKGNCDKTLETLNKFYRIYSYEDEWYLVDGQKWHRECGTFKLEEEEEEETPALVVEDSVNTLAEQPDPEVGNGAVSPPEEKPVAAIAAAEKVPVKERLIPVEKHDHEVQTRAVSSSVNVSLYGVQVGAFLEPKFTRQFDGLKNVEVYVDRNGVFRYVIGRFPYLSQARKLLAYVREVGYSDAFIVDINRGNPKYKEEVVAVDEQNIKRKLTGNIQYRVQVGAFREEVPEDMIKTYLTLDDLREYIQGDLTILTIGNYKSYDIAKAYCSDVKSAHVPDAFVVAFNQGYKIPLDEAINYQAEREEDLERQRQKQRRKGFWFFKKKR